MQTGRHAYSHTCRQRNRQTDKNIVICTYSLTADRQIDRQTDRQTDGQTDGLTYWQTEGWTKEMTRRKIKELVGVASMVADPSSPNSTAYTDIHGTPHN